MKTQAALVTALMLAVQLARSDPLYISSSRSLSALAGLYHSSPSIPSVEQYLTDSTSQLDGPWNSALNTSVSAEPLDLGGLPSTQTAGSLQTDVSGSQITYSSAGSGVGFGRGYSASSVISSILDITFSLSGDHEFTLNGDWQYGLAGMAGVGFAALIDSVGFSLGSGPSGDLGSFSYSGVLAPGDHRFVVALLGSGQTDGYADYSAALTAQLNLVEVPDGGTTVSLASFSLLGLMVCFKCFKPSTT